MVDRNADDSSKWKVLIVGAIDFGTTYSGWGFSFLHDFQSDPTRVCVKQWHSGSGTLVTEKAPTCVLIRPDGETLEAFGYDAENRYRELVDDEAHEGYYYFRRFKMALNKKLNEKVNKHLTIEDAMGKSLPALTVFARTIEFLTGDMVKEAKQKLAGSISKADVNWVLTVPAIWTDSAKQFMREAAIEAGLDTNKLVIALEPEAASIVYRHLSVDVTAGEQYMSVSKFKPGTRYMIFDAGGGTIDITVHEVTLSGGLKEVHAATGGGWGGILVDEAFENLLFDLVGEKVYDDFKKAETEDWIDLWRDFEVKKKTVKPEKDSRINMKFPLSLAKMYKKINRQSLDEAIAVSRYSEDIEFGGDKIKCQASLMKSLFDCSIKTTISHMKTLMRHKNIKDVKAILMVGGFSESLMLQHAVKTTFPETCVIVPPDPASAIMKGAVVFGHSPNAITERVLKYTYGVRINTYFREGVHLETKRILTDSGAMCKDIFSKHAEKDETVAVGRVLKKHIYQPTNHDTEAICFQIYASELKKPMYVDQGCTNMGNITVNLIDPDRSLERNVLVSFLFGGTEIEVKAEDEKSGEITTATVNFLG